MGAEQSGEAYFSLRHLNINQCDLFISPDVPLQSRLHQLSNRALRLYFLSSCLLNCSFLISKPSVGDLFHCAGFLAKAKKKTKKKHDFSVLLVFLKFLF